MAEEKTNIFTDKGLPGWAKGTIAVGAIAGIGIVGFLVYKKISDLADKAKTNSDLNTTLSETDAALHVLTETQKQNYPDTTYQGWANTIYTLVDGCDFGTNSPKVMLIFSNLKNDTDYLKLVKAFGKKTINNCGWGSGTYNGDLPTVLNKEVSTDIIDKINKYLSSNGFKSKI